MKLTAYALLIAAFGAGPMLAQETSHLTGQLGGGFTMGIGRTGSYLDTGWNITGGLGWNFNQYVGALVDISDSHLGINSSTLGNIGVPGGDVNLFTATLDPIIHLMPRNHVDVYITGGGGLFRRNQEFTAPSSATVFGFNPFFGFYPATVPATTILSSYSVNKPGIDVGIGFAVGTKWHGKLYAEAKYDRMFYNNYFHTDYLPVTFGYRW